MDYLWVIIPIAIVVALIIIFALKSRSKRLCSADDIVGGENNLVPAVSQSMKISSSQETGIIIPVELLPATTQIDEGRLFEITDSTVIARISQTIPGAAQTVANTAAKNIAKETLSNPNMFLVNQKRSSIRHLSGRKKRTGGSCKARLLQNDKSHVPC